MEPKEYFPRKPGEEPFEPPFTGAVKPEKNIAKRVCAWCRKEIGEKEAEGSKVTDGICEECHAKEIAGLKEKK